MRLMAIENETPSAMKDREQLQRIAAGVAQAVSGYLPKGAGIGFAVVLFDFGDGGNMAYASNGNRGDVAKTLRELLEKLLFEAEAEAVQSGRSRS